jgi:tripartite-type tricarboxylate transporter receptor subunit TctC
VADTRQKLVDLGAVPVGSTPAQFQQRINNDRKRYALVIKEKNISTD